MSKILNFLNFQIERIGFIPSMSVKLKIPSNKLESDLESLVKQGVVVKVNVPCVNSSTSGITVHEDLYSIDLEKKPDDFEIISDIDYEPIDSSMIELVLGYKLVTKLKKSN